MSDVETKKVTPKRKKTYRDYYRAKPEQYSGHHKAFVQKVKEEEGISIREKYLETSRRAERNCKHRQNAILAIKYLFGIRYLI
jgi:hypothetical protein